MGSTGAAFQLSAARRRSDFPQNSQLLINSGSKKRSIIALDHNSGGAMAPIVPGRAESATIFTIDGETARHHQEKESYHHHLSSTKSHDRAVKWEEVPLTLNDGCNGTDAGDKKKKSEAEQSSAKKPHSFYQKTTKILKILVPHVGLTIVLLSYIVVGAVILKALEQDTELLRRREKVMNISRIYRNIINETWLQCERKVLFTRAIFNQSELILTSRSMTFEDWKNLMQRYLMELSNNHEFDLRQPVEEQGFSLDPNDIRSRWTLQASVLYALTILTTTGYDHITPQTDAGKIVSVFFGLIGIPLMFITAADIGKFLSEMFRRVYMKMLKFWRYSWRMLVRCCKFGKAGRKLVPTLATEKGGGDGGGSPGDDQNDSEDSTEEPDYENINLPVFAYFGLILSYCAIGALLYTSWEKGPVWSFLHAFHFSFNTITTISLGNILVRDAVYLCLIVCYVIIGLAVVTMCVDLASSQLKVFFTKLHYFGRKMRGARTAFEHMSDDIKEAMRIISHIRKSKQKGNITVDDIKHFLEIQHHFILRPFTPNNIGNIHFVDEDDASSTISSTNMGTVATFTISNHLAQSPNSEFVNSQ